MASQLWALSEAWIVRYQDALLTLERPVAGTHIEIEGIPGSGLGSLVEALRTQFTLAELKALSNLPASELDDLTELLIQHGIIRPVPTDSGSLVSTGEGPLRDALASLHGLAVDPLPSIHVWQPDLEPTGPRPAGSRLIAMLLGDRLLAIQEGSQACRHCLILRAMGKLGERGDLQNHLLSRPQTPDPGRLRNLAGEFLQILGDFAGHESHGVWIEPGIGTQEGHVIQHPDCPWCRSERGLLQIEAQHIRAVLSAPQRETRGLASMRSRLVESPFAPIALHRAEGPSGRYPLDLPYLTGDVHLTRYRESIAVCSSVQAIVYGAGSDADQCQVIAISEGVERLAALGARSDLHIEDDTPAVDPRTLRSPAGDRISADGGGEYCHGLDLLSNKPVLIPYEVVVVSLPEPLYPRASVRLDAYSGTASHRTFLQAVIHATVELLKRDAFMISWYRKRQLPALQWPQRMSNLSADRADFLRRHEVEIELFDLHLQVRLPMVLARLTASRAVGSWPRGGALLVPAGGFTAMEALEHALGLACGRLVSLRDAPPSQVNPTDPESVDRLAKRHAYWPLMARYLNPANRAAHDFLGGERRPFESIRDSQAGSAKEKFKLLKSWLREASVRWLTVRLTEATARAAGFEVAKIVIPELVGLAPSRAAVDLELPRLHQRWPKAAIEGLNPDPHPLY